MSRKIFFQRIITITKERTVGIIGKIYLDRKDKDMIFFSLKK